MSEHAVPEVERHCDVCVVGQSTAGLAAALHLGRAGRSVIVVGAAAGPSAGFDELHSYGVEILPLAAIGVNDDTHGHRVALEGGHTVVARRIVTGRGGGDDMIAALDEEDRQSRAAVSGNQADWDHRYGGGQMWSGNPNGTLVQEAQVLATGRALDVGAGEGGDAIWLAEQGWRVTAADVSARALERVAAEAQQRGLEIDCVRADANGPSPFEPAAYDLVSAQYASIPRTPDGRAVANILAAVRPGGTLLVVSHNLEPLRAHAGPLHAQPFDPDAFVRVEDFADVVSGSPRWTVDVFETRPRPPGAVSSHHVEDIVLRARRND